MGNGVNLSSTQRVQTQAQQALQQAQTPTMADAAKTKAASGAKSTSTAAPAGDQFTGRTTRRTTGPIQTQDAMRRPTGKTPFQQAGVRSAEAKAAGAKFNLSAEYIDAATQHTESRSPANDRIELHSQIRESDRLPNGQVRKDASGHPVLRYGALERSVFQHSIQAHADTFMKAFHDGDVVDMGGGKVFHVPADTQALRGEIIKRMTGRLKGPPHDKLTSPTPGHPEGTYVDMIFTKVDGKFVLQNPPTPKAGPALEGWNVKPRPLGHYDGMFTTAAVPNQNIQGWATAAASDPATKPQYYFGSMSQPDPKDPGHTLRADIKGFSPPHLSSDPAKISVGVFLANHDVESGRLAPSTTLHGRSAIEFLTRVGVLQKGSDGSYHVAVNGVGSNATDGPTTYEQNKDVFAWNSLRGLAGQTALGALSDGGNTQVLLDGLKQVAGHAGKGGKTVYEYGAVNSGYGSVDTKKADDAEFSKIANGWIKSWQGDVAQWRSQGMSDTQIRQRLAGPNGAMSKTLTDFFNDRDFSRLMSTLGTQTLEQSVSHYMAAQ